MECIRGDERYCDEGRAMIEYILGYEFICSFYFFNFRIHF